MVGQTTMMDTEWPYGAAQDGTMVKGKLGEGELVALEQALHNGTVVKKLVACQLLRKELEDRPVETAPVLDRPGMLEGLCVAISSKDAPCYREASVVLKLFVLANEKASFKIAGVPYLLHALCKLAVQQDDPDVIALLTTMARNHRVLWLVSNLTKIMRVHLLHEQYLLRDAFDAFHDSVLIRQLPELQREQPKQRPTSQPVSLPQERVRDVRDQATPSPPAVSLPRETPSSLHQAQDKSSRPTQRMCDVDDFLADHTRIESMSRSRRSSASSIVVCDVEEWLPNMNSSRNPLYASWSSPNSAQHHPRGRQGPPRTGSWQGPPDSHTDSWQLPSSTQRAGEPPPFGHHVPAVHPRPDASFQISEAQELLRQHMKSRQQQPNVESAQMIKSSLTEPRPSTPVVVYNGPPSAPRAHERVAEPHLASMPSRIVSDVQTEHQGVAATYPDQRSMYVYNHPQGLHRHYSSSSGPHTNMLPRAWNLHQAPPALGVPSRHTEYVPQPPRAQPSVQVMPGVSPSEYLRWSQQTQMMQSQLASQGRLGATDSKGAGPLQQFTVGGGWRERLFRRESGDPDNLCQVEEWLEKDAGRLTPPDYGAGQREGWVQGGLSYAGGYHARDSEGNSSDDDEWV